MDVAAARPGWQADLAAWGRSWWRLDSLVAVPLYLVFAWVLRETITFSWGGPPYFPDSWSYVELSRSAFVDPGHIRTFRAFGSTVPYTTSFPPAWPASVAVVRTLTGVGVQASMLAAGLAAFGAAVVLDGAGQRLFGRRGLGPAVLLVLFLFVPLEQEVVSGGSFPLAVLMCAGVLRAAAAPWPLERRSLIVTGVWLGLLAMTRFDTLGFVLLVPPALVVARAVPWRRAAWAYAGWAVVMAPWVLYSLVHFGRPFVSDNASVATAADDHFVLDYFTAEMPTVRTAPGQWFARIRSNLGSFVPHQWDIVTHSLSFRVAVLCLVVATVLAGVGLAVRRSGGWRDAAHEVVTARGVRLGAVLVVVEVVALAVAQATTGYFDARYSTLLLLLVLFTIGCLVLALPVQPWLLAVLGTAGVVLVGVVPVRQLRGEVDVLPPFARYGLDPTPDVEYLAACLGPDDRVLLLDGSSVTYAYGALSEGTAIVLPSNWRALEPEDRMAFLDDFDVDYYYMGSTTPPERQAAMGEDLVKLTAGGVTLQGECISGLYRLERT